MLPSTNSRVWAAVTSCDLPVRAQDLRVWWGGDRGQPCVPFKHSELLRRTLANCSNRKTEAGGGTEVMPPAPTRSRVAQPWGSLSGGDAQGEPLPPRSLLGC